MGLVCAIHQPNLAPRLSTLAKLHAADVWIVLDDVQFNARDYQHRARLALPDQPERQQWLSIPAHRPAGRATCVSEVRVADSAIARRRLALLTAQFYRRTPGWGSVSQVVHAAITTLDATSRLAPIAEASTVALLALLGWKGTVVHSSSLTARPGRSQRLADLTAAVGASTYLCGTGGARYVTEAPFTDLGLSVHRWSPGTGELWQFSRRVSSLYPLAVAGPSRLTQTIRETNESVGQTAEPVRRT